MEQETSLAHSRRAPCAHWTTMAVKTRLLGHFYNSCCKFCLDSLCAVWTLYVDNLICTKRGEFPSFSFFFKKRSCCLLLLLPLCLWVDIYVLLACGYCIFMLSLFCHKDSRIQALYFFVFLPFFLLGSMSLGTDLCGSSMWMLYFCGILFCCKDSRIQAMCWHKKLALML